MPRSVTPAFATAAAAGRVKPAFLFEGLFDSGALRLWTGYGQITWNSNVYTGAGIFMAVDTIEESNGVEANGCRFSLNGIPSGVLSLSLAEPYQGRVVRLYQAFLTSAGAIVADPDLLFTGFADLMNLEDAGETCTIELTAESRLIALQRARSRRYEDQDQKIDYPTDRFFEFVSIIQDKPVKWGT